MHATALFLALSLTPANHTCDPEVDRALERLERTLERLERETDEVGARDVRKRLRRQVRDAQRAAEHIRSEACRAFTPEAPPPPAPPPPPVDAYLPPQLLPPIDDATLRGLIAAIRAESFADGKVDVLESGIAGQCVTVSQTRQLLELFTFSASKMKAARMLAPRLADRQRAFQLFKALTFSKDKEELKKILDTVPPEAACWGG